MQIEELRQIYDDEQRFHIEFTDTKREALPALVRHTMQTGRRKGWVMWSKLDDSTIDAAIDEQIAYFEQLGQGFEWKVFSHDKPADLKQRLAARGFEIREPDDAILVLDLDDMPDILKKPVPDGIRQVTDPAEIPTLMTVLSDVYEEDFSELGEEIAGQITQTPPVTSLYAAYVDGKPVSVAWVFYDLKSRFGSLWGGTTLADYRKRGFYTGLLAVRAADARKRGKRFLTVDASPMSRPILEKLGFVCITMATECNWIVNKTNSESSDEKSD